MSRETAEFPAKESWNFFYGYPICSKTAGLESLKESVGEWLPAVHAGSRLAVSSRRNCAITCRIVSLKQVQHVWRHCVTKWFGTSYYHKQAGLSGHVPKQAFSGGWMSAWLETGRVENWTCSVILLGDGGLN